MPAARTDPELRQYELRRLRVPVGSGSLSLVVPDAGTVRRRGEWTAAALRGGEPPYWSRIWPAAVAAARALRRRAGLDGARVLDLGCGLGLPGIAAAGAGAAVTFADREPAALAFARWNAVRAAGAARVTTVALDWARTVVSGTFDVVVLADVTYRALHHEPLRRQLGRGLAPGGVVLHADPLRAAASPFVAWLRTELVGIEAVHTVTFGGERTAVRLVAAAREARALAPWAAALGGPPAPAGAAP